MKFFRFVIFVIFLAFAGLMTAGCAARTVYVKTPPPAARHEARPSKPFANAFWIPGHWEWRGGSYVWKSGYWVKPVKGKKWVAGHWRKTGSGYVWVNGNWRLTFRFDGKDAELVDYQDYH